jgi:hypothetical protein
VHVFAREAPAVVEYVLAAQSMHALASDAPTVPEYFPAPHCSHALSLVAPRVVEYLPAVQSLQSSEPTTDLNLPAGQAEHAGYPSQPFVPDICCNVIPGIRFAGGVTASPPTLSLVPPAPEPPSMPFEPPPIAVIDENEDGNPFTEGLPPAPTEMAYGDSSSR